MGDRAVIIRWSGCVISAEESAIGAIAAISFRRKELNRFGDDFNHGTLCSGLVFVRSLVEASIDTDHRSLLTILSDILRRLIPAGAGDEACASVLSVASARIIDSDSEGSHGSTRSRSSELRISDDSSD